MVVPFPSHPNYVGYDAYAGNPRALHPAPKAELQALSRPVAKADFPHIILEKGWVGDLERVRQWCANNDAKFTVLPHEYQFAKVTGRFGRIVLYASKVKGKGIRPRYIKPVAEVRSVGIDEAMDAVSATLVDRGR